MITIIPAIDIIGGQCVRLTRGAYDSKKVYDSNPLTVARRFEQAGFKRLHLVDLDGAREKRVINWPVLQSIAGQTRLQIDFGGGLRSDEDIEKVFAAGVKQVTAGSIAVKEPLKVEQWLKRYGPQCIILGADARDGRITVSGWQQESTLDIVSFIHDYEQKGIRTVISTDVNRDGLLSGPAFDLYQRMRREFPRLKIIASGGISNVDEIKQLDDLGIDGVIVGKAIYEGRILLQELEGFLC